MNPTSSKSPQKNSDVAAPLRLKRQRVKIGQRWIGDDEPVFVTFEGGATHTGFTSAKEMIRASRDAGGDAVKFQTIFVDKIMSKKDVIFDYETASGNKAESLAQILKRREMPYKDWEALKKEADAVGIPFFSTPDSPETIDFLAKIGVPCIKMAGGDMNNYPLIRYAASTKLPILLDTRGTLGELERAIESCLLQNNDQIIIVHCPSGYPSALKSIRLKLLQVYLNTFPFPVGFSDHNPGMDMDVAAIALGAHFIEKTISTNRATESVEHVMSLELNEMKDFVRRVRELETALSHPYFHLPSAEEKAGMKKGRRSIVLKKDTAAGETLTADLMNFKRPGYGIPPEMAETLVGWKLRRPVTADMPLSWADLTDVHD